MLVDGINYLKQKGNSMENKGNVCPDCDQHPYSDKDNMCPVCGTEIINHMTKEKQLRINEIISILTNNDSEFLHIFDEVICLIKEREGW